MTSFLHDWREEEHWIISRMSLLPILLLTAATFLSFAHHGLSSQKPLSHLPLVYSLPSTPLFLLRLLACGGLQWGWHPAPSYNTPSLIQTRFTGVGSH